MPHYYDEKQAGEMRPFRIAIRARGVEISLWSAGGVFSKDRLDAGTKLLIDTCVLQPGWRVHDLGCGYGAVGLVVKVAEPSCSVLLSDVNERAVALARRNAKDLDVEVRKSDGYASVPETFDTVLLNPPYVAGREMVFRLLGEVHGHLARGGLLQVVAQHQKGGKAIRERLLELFGNCDDSRKRGGFRVYVSRK